LGVGTAAGNNATLPAGSFFVSYNFTDSLLGRLGVNYSQDNAAGAAATTRTGFSGGIDYMLPQKLGGVQTFIGGQYSTDGAAAATNVISLLLGIRTELAKKVTLSTGLVPYSTSSAGGASSTTITTGAGHINFRGPFISISVEIN
jgi:hypothetical protein